MWLILIEDFERSTATTPYSYFSRVSDVILVYGNFFLFSLENFWGKFFFIIDKIQCRLSYSLEVITCRVLNVMERTHSLCTQFPFVGF